MRFFFLAFMFIQLFPTIQLKQNPLPPNQCLTSSVLFVFVRYSRESLKILGTVGEPINPEAWLWYYNVVGNGKCAIVDTFWQTETVSFCFNVLDPPLACSVKTLYNDRMTDLLVPEYVVWMKIIKLMKCRQE